MWKPKFIYESLPYIYALVALFAIFMPVTLGRVSGFLFADCSYSNPECVTTTVNSTRSGNVTRINLIHPSELTDQHLFAEFREIKMIPKSLRRSLRAAWQRELDKNDSNDFSEQRARLAMDSVLKKIPKSYTLNTGHVSFFYDKAAYLKARYALLRIELMDRGINFNYNSLLDDANVFDELPAEFHKYYHPTEEALSIVRKRIAEKIEMKIPWYRYKGTPLTNNPFGAYLHAV